MKISNVDRIIENYRNLGIIPTPGPTPGPTPAPTPSRRSHGNDGGSRDRGRDTMDHGNTNRDSMRSLISGFETLSSEDSDTIPPHSGIKTHHGSGQAASSPQFGGGTGVRSGDGPNRFDSGVRLFGMNRSLLVRMRKKYWF